MDIPVFSSF